jgi:hypothetical protein
MGKFAAEEILLRKQLIYSSASEDATCCSREDAFVLEHIPNIMQFSVV